MKHDLQVEGKARQKAEGLHLEEMHKRMKVETEAENLRRTLSDLQSVLQRSHPQDQNQLKLWPPHVTTTYSPHKRSAEDQVEDWGASQEVN